MDGPEPHRRPPQGPSAEAGEEGDAQRIRDQQARILLDHMYQFVALLDRDGQTCSTPT